MHISSTHCNLLSMQAKLSMVAAERDSAVREMRNMAEQCHRVAGEFDSMAQHCDLLIRENKRVCIIICLSVFNFFAFLRYPNYKRIPYNIFYKKK